MREDAQKLLTLLYHKGGLNVLLIPYEQISQMLQDAEDEIKKGLEKVYKRKGIEDGMRQINRGIGSLQTVRRLIKNQSTVDVNISIKK
jgi:hypothetical protein